MFNYGAPIASTDATMCVSDEDTAYIGIAKGFEFVKSLSFVIPTYEDPALLTHMVASIDAIGAP